MKRILGFAVGSVLCLALVGVPASAADSEATVGDFAVSLAKMVTKRPSFTEKDAVALLGQMGIELQGNVDEALKQGFVVDALNQLGANLTTSNPEQPMTGSDADQIIRLFDAGAGFPGTEGVEEGIKCKAPGTPVHNQPCRTDADCPGGYCNVPPGLAKKLASPSDD